MMRLATSSDINKIKVFYQRHRTVNVHSQSTQCITSMVATNAVILEENAHDGEIDACIEVLTMTTQEGIKSFCQNETPGFVFPYQENGILMYAAGLLKRKGSSTTQISKRAAVMASNLAGASGWRKSRQQWAKQIFESPSPRPSRVVCCFGMMVNEVTSTVFLKKALQFNTFICEKVLGERALHTLTKYSPSPDGSGR